MDAALVRAYLTELQAAIVDRLGALDGHAFRRDSWQRPAGGGGLSCLIEDGALFERAGVNFSHVTGLALPPSASASRPELAGRAFEAMGVSLVLHPRNPYVPTVHMNVRFFVATRTEADPVWWFGGGMDLTPYYGFEEDAIHFHRTCRASLSAFGAELYPRYKQWCDEYFFLKHRNEPRGIGGIFFDDLNKLTSASSRSCVRRRGSRSLPANRRAAQDLSVRSTRAISGLSPRPLRRINLVYDRGTFGLQSGVGVRGDPHVVTAHREMAL
jgi:coproporphyrinogen III oxidase